MGRISAPALVIRLLSDVRVFTTCSPLIIVELQQFDAMFSSVWAKISIATNLFGDMYEPWGDQWHVQYDAVVHLRTKTVEKHWILLLGFLLKMYLCLYCEVSEYKDSVNIGILCFSKTRNTGTLKHGTRERMNWNEYELKCICLKATCSFCTCSKATCTAKDTTDLMQVVYINWPDARCQQVVSSLFTLSSRGITKRRVMKWRVISDSYDFRELCSIHAQTTTTFPNDHAPKLLFWRKLKLLKRRFNFATQTCLGFEKVKGI
jgi:hypothetical protein